MKKMKTFVIVSAVIVIAAAVIFLPGIGSEYFGEPIPLLETMDEGRGMRDEGRLRKSEVKRPEQSPVGQTAAPKYDLTDTSHWNLTVSAWEALAAKDYEGVLLYAGKCVELYGDEARTMAASMKSFSGIGHEDDYVLVNDVATSHYIMGESYMRQEKPQEAIAEFEHIISNYPYAQCWDPKGWFWKVAEISKINITKIKELK